MVVSDGGVGWTRLNNSEKRERKKKRLEDPKSGRETR